ncbi:flagellar hook-basal body protein [Sedimentibacter sp. SX930]|nr:flagellar hook-basal body protein [Sedimentibacter sp. SX930]
MIRSLDTVGHQFNLLQKKQENLSTNIANVNTSGYKYQELVQSTTETFQFGNNLNGPMLNQQNPIDGLNFGNQIDTAYRNLSQGGLKGTNSRNDFALMGDAFFTVQMPNGGQAVTRNGNFAVDATGNLTTQEGYLVLGRNQAGQIATIPAGSVPFTVDQTGNVNATGVRFLLTDNVEAENLQSIGDTLFSYQAGMTTDDDTLVLQKYLETSNVDMTDHMVQMMQLTREFEANQKILHASDETLSKAVNEIGKV